MTFWVAGNVPSLIALSHFGKGLTESPCLINFFSDLSLVSSILRYPGSGNKNWL